MPKQGHYPTQQQPELVEGELSEKISFMQALSDWEFTNEPEQVRERVKWFFNQCARHDTRPTVALLAVALNTSRQTMWQWEKRGGELGEIISQAKRILNALLEDWSVCGKINPVAAVWLQKNHFGYRDERNYAVETIPQRDPTAGSMTPEEIEMELRKIPDYKDADSARIEEERQNIIARRIAQDIPIDSE